ncbi:MAG: MTH938/NDUFAF3 family protein [Candidatus Brocadiaceae bacterium]|nr:MTH938/NDUFAF3 family protein [Candidatus Brocadiaceae bacterium]
MEIDDCSFGRIKIDGHEYTRDVIIYPNRIDSSWWRKEGHRLQIEDVGDILGTKPDILVVGRGQYGGMKIDKGVEDLLRTKGIELRAAETPEACQIHNRLIKSKKIIVTALHLTC